MSPESPDILIQGVSFYYQSQSIFDSLSLKFPAKKWSCLLGSSGVGKSTLLRMIAGLETAGHGVVFTSDQHSLAGRVAFMTQQDSLMPWATVLDNILIGYRLRQGKVSIMEQDRAQELLLKVGLDNTAKLYPNQLSGGMRQRVALARTLLEDKPIILMDEAFTALDVATKYSLYQLFVELLENKTVVMVTHDPLEALCLGDYVHVLAGSPASIVQSLSLADVEKPRSLNCPQVLSHHDQILRFMCSSRVSR